MINAVLEIARLQRLLLSYKFDITGFTPVNRLENKRSSSEYEKLLKELESAKAALNNIVMKDKGEAGLYWWNIPWKYTENTLIELLDISSERCGWRFESEICSEGEKNRYLIYMEEEGHCGSFTYGDIEYEYSEISEYTPDERDEMVKSFNKRINNLEMLNILTTEGKVYSKEYDRVYDSALSYYMSFEHRLNRHLDSELYSRMLYKEKETAVMNIYSSSRHFKCIYELAGVSVDEYGYLTDLSIGNMKQIAKSGDVPQLKGYTAQKAGILSAAYLANSDKIKGIPSYSFNISFLSEAHDFYEAAYAAQIFTLIGDKLVYDSDNSRPYLISSEDDFENCKTLLTDLMNERELSEEQLINAWGYIVDNSLPLEPMLIPQIKAACLIGLADKQSNFYIRYFYSACCADISVGYYAKEQNNYLLLAAAQSASCAADCALRLDMHAYSAQYARLALSVLDGLLRIVPSDKDIAAQKRSLKKILKKAEGRGLFGK